MAPTRVERAMTRRVERIMKRQRGTRPLALGVTLVLGLTLTTGCTSRPEPAPPRDTTVAPGGFRLVAFDSCADALAQLRVAAQAYVGPWGFGNEAGRAVRLDARRGAAGDAAVAEAGAAPMAPNEKSSGAGPTGYSGTNNHEAGVDEPDLVKTDGGRIVMVSGGVLRVIDPATRRLTDKIDLAGSDDRIRWAESHLLLHGDRALVLVSPHLIGMATRGVPGGVRPDNPPPEGITGPRLILIDLAGPPAIIGEYTIDGALVDARQVNNVVRVVVRSTPRLDFPYRDGDVSEQKRLAANRKVIETASIADWLPRYEWTGNGTKRTGRVGCDRLSRPTTYSGASLITVLSFDLDPARSGRPGADEPGVWAGGTGVGLGDGDPVTVVADGDTVYSNGPRLYIANDQRWRVLPTLLDGDRAPKPEDEVTEIYQFDTSGPGRPRYVTAATVPGWLINQYAMSEWDGHLRVATTSGRTWGERPQSSSAVYVLRADGSTLTETGRVTGLGRGERIYAVRFAAGIGYVVTFRQTDPLYTVDLSDPAAPRVTGELKITGYSAYLHPIDAGRLLGIGQEASRQGRTEGAQISLFDVTDLTEPSRLARYHVRRGHSEAEFDPHAFLYWPATRLLVVPLTAYDASVGGKRAPVNGALALRVTDAGFTELGMVDHAGETGSPYAPIRRSLVVDGVLWTFSEAAAKATDMTTMDTVGLLRLT